MSIKATVNPTDETAEITKEEQIADARENETTLLDGLLTAAGFKTSEECIKNVVISRGGKDLFSFHIHPLSEEDYNSCRKKFTKYVKSKVQGGIRVPEEVNAVDYRARADFPRHHPGGSGKGLVQQGAVEKARPCDRLRGGERPVDGR